MQRHIRLAVLAVSVSLAFPAFAQEGGPPVGDAAQQDSIHFRWGLEGRAGFAHIADTTTPDVGNAARFGIQFLPMLGAYVDFGFDAGEANGFTSSFMLMHLAPMLEWDHEWFFLGAGPMAALALWHTDPGPLNAGPVLGLDARTGVTLGRRSFGGGGRASRSPSTSRPSSTARPSASRPCCAWAMTLSPTSRHALFSV